MPHTQWPIRVSERTETTQNDDVTEADDNGLAEEQNDDVNEDQNNGIMEEQNDALTEEQSDDTLPELDSDNEPEASAE